MLHFRQASDEQPLLRVYNPQGQLVSRLYPLRTLADVQSAGLIDVAMTKNRTLLVVVVATSTQNKMASGVLELDLNGSLKRIIKTDPFVPQKIAIDDDNNIWLLGYDWQQLRKNHNWAQVHKLSPEGKPLVSTLSRSLFPKEFDPLNIASPEIRHSNVYFGVVGEKVYAWLSGVNQLAILGLDGQILQLVDKPFRTLFGRDAKVVEILSLVFLPKDRLVVQAWNLDGKGTLFAHGWFFSANLGQTWSPMSQNLQDPLAARLIGWTSPAEFVFLRLVNQWTGVLEFCPVVF